jgi:hypothetical protein
MIAVLSGCKINKNYRDNPKFSAKNDVIRSFYRNFAT